MCRSWRTTSSSPRRRSDRRLFRNQFARARHHQRVYGSPGTRKSGCVRWRPRDAEREWVEMRQQGKAGVSAARWFGLVVAGLVAAVDLAGCSSTATGSGATSPSLPVTNTATASANLSLEPSVTPILAPSASPAPLQFVATGSMHTARRQATATLLKTGKVLIAGGDTGGNARTIYASAELYDPATGKFSKTGSMTSARTWASASLLADGRVLIAGGEGCADPRKCIGAGSGPGGWDGLASAEVYDPAKGSFSATGSMTTPRDGASATVLPDGRVLVADQASIEIAGNKARILHQR